MTLDTAERAKFATYLEVMADSARLIITQLEKIPGMGPVIERERQEMAAAKIIANKLRAIEEFTA